MFSLQPPAYATRENVCLMTDTYIYTSKRENKGYSIDLA